MSRPTRIAAALVSVAALVAAGACGGNGGSGDQAGGAGTGDGAGAVAGTVRVFAAASLTDAFGEVGDAFEDAHPRASVELNLDGSSSLRDQILAGAPADVFASASGSTMGAVAEAGEVDGEPRPFATNELAIVVPAGNPAGVDGLDDLGDESLLVGLCAEEVPCGELGRRALDRAGVTPAPDTEEPDVRSLLERVGAGELDVGLVYRTDVLAAGDRVESVDMPAEDNVVAEYPIAVLAGAGEPAAAQAFVDLVLSDRGQEILRSYGFGPP